MAYGSIAFAILDIGCMQNIMGRSLQNIYMRWNEILSLVMIKDWIPRVTRFADKKYIIIDFKSVYYIGNTGKRGV